MKSLLFFFFMVCEIYSCSVFCQEKKEVIAAQALFKEELLLDSLRAFASQHEKISSAREHGARPHMTIASFKLTNEEKKEISETFTKMDSVFISHKFQVEPKVFTKDSSVWSFYLVPVSQDSLLINTHDSLYIQLDNQYERYRKMDEPNFWWPHISLFKVSGDEPGLPDMLQIRLDEIEWVTIKGFSLVSFGPIDYYKEINTK